MSSKGNEYRNSTEAQQALQDWMDASEHFTFDLEEMKKIAESDEPFFTALNSALELFEEFDERLDSLE